MRPLLLTGPPASGKNTIAQLLAKRLPRSAVIDVDDVRHMVVQPHRAPWEGEEGEFQQRLGVTNASLLAGRTTDAGFATVILDVISSDTAALYRRSLVRIGVMIVLLLPSWSEIEQRTTTRTMRLTPDELRSLYEQQRQFAGYDMILDNSELSAEAAAAWLDKRWHESAGADQL